MIGRVLVFLRNHLNECLNARFGGAPGESREDKVVFVDGEKMDPITFKLGAVTTLLVNIEEDNTLRPSDRYATTTRDGASMKVQPEVRLNLYVLFVARFKQYEHGLAHLSQIVQYFQNHPVLDHRSAPEMSEDIEKLVFELITLPFAELNELWSALRTTYHPSVLYRVRMVVFKDEDARRAVEVKEKDLKAAL